MLKATVRKWWDSLLGKETPDHSRICKDCVHFRPEDRHHHRCGRELVSETVWDLVSGASQVRLMGSSYSAASERSYIGSNYCGPSGKYYKSK